MSSAPIGLRTRFWVEATLTPVSGTLTLVTMFWRDWLEAFGLDPDHGNGTAEWLGRAVPVIRVEPEGLKPVTPEHRDEGEGSRDGGQGCLDPEAGSEPDRC